MPRWQMCYVYETLHKIQYKLSQYMILDRANLCIHSPEWLLKLPAVNMLKSWPITSELPDKSLNQQCTLQNWTTCFIIYRASHRKTITDPLLYITRKFSTSFTFFNFKNMLFVHFLSGDWRDGYTTVNILLKMDMCWGTSKWIKHKHPNQQAAWPYIKALHWFLKSKLHLDHVTIWDYLEI